MKHGSPRGRGGGGWQTNKTPDFGPSESLFGSRKDQIHVIMYTWSKSKLSTCQSLARQTDFGNATRRYWCSGGAQNKVMGLKSEIYLHLKHTTVSKRRKRGRETKFIKLLDDENDFQSPAKKVKVTTKEEKFFFYICTADTICLESTSQSISLPLDSGFWQHSSIWLETLCDLE